MTALKKILVFCNFKANCSNYPAQNRIVSVAKLQKGLNTQFQTGLYGKVRELIEEEWDPEPRDSDISVDEPGHLETANFPDDSKLLLA